MHIEIEIPGYELLAPAPAQQRAVRELSQRTEVAHLEDIGV
jgi:hypothetical protein